MNGVALSTNGQIAVSASRDHTLKVWDVSSRQLLRSLEGHTNTVNVFALSANGQIAVSASRDHTLKVWDVATGQILLTQVVTSTTTCCTISSDSNAIVAGDYAGATHFIDWVRYDGSESLP